MSVGRLSLANDWVASALRKPPALETSTGALAGAGFPRRWSVPWLWLPAAVNPRAAAIALVSYGNSGRGRQGRLLRAAIERYRQEKHGPLLARASTLFDTLTLGAFRQLVVDFEGDGPRLAGVRADGATVVPVEGMSEGTLDQLFLALRVAAVEDAVDQGHILPFLADDLFVNFDNERSAAGFRVLAELSRKTQVLFFTHHSHLAEVAAATLVPDIVSVCQLDRADARAAVEPVA